LIPTSKHARIVARLFSSVAPGLVMPAIGQHPKEISEISIPEFPSGR